MTAGLVVAILVSAAVVVVAVAARWLGPGTGGERSVATVRELFRFAVLYGALWATVAGAVTVAQELIEPDDGDSNLVLARALAFVIVGTPVFALTLVLGLHSAARWTPARRWAWSRYLDLALATTLAGAIVEWTSTIAELLDRFASSTSDLPADAAVAAVIWSAAWALHWFALRGRIGIEGELHLATATIIGLVPLGIGVFGLVTGALDALFALVDATHGTTGPALTDAVALTIVGGGAWAWHWLARYRRWPRTDLWQVTAVPLGALVPLVIAMVALSLLLNEIGVWLVGDPSAIDAAEHFRFTPSMGGAIAAGLVIWAYHRAVVRSEPRPPTEATDPDRATADRTRPAASAPPGLPERIYGYLLAAAGLGAAVVGATTTLAGSLATDDRVNTIIAGVAMVAVGGPIWVWSWAAIDRRARTGDRLEAATVLHRFYLIAVIGVGVVATVVAMLVALTVVLEDVLDGAIGRASVDDARVPIATVVVVGSVTAYHLVVARRRGDRRHSPDESPSSRGTEEACSSPLRASAPSTTSPPGTASAPTP